MKYENHLVDPIRCLLDAADAPLSEYEIIQQLKAQEWLPELSMTDTVSLYSAHFLVYNALFQLSEIYREQGTPLFISALSIYCYPYCRPLEPCHIDIAGNTAGNEAKHISAQAEDLSSTTDVVPNIDISSVHHADNQALMPELSTYYLNWDHLKSATQDSVDDLLSGFWERFAFESSAKDGLGVLSQQEYAQAIKVLDVDIGSSYSDIKRRYRQLAMKYHPDRDGDKDLFQAVQSAFSYIRRYQQRNLSCN